ncbi:glycosyltransferase family 4 protein [Gillisia sp. M10.2A]|uniref:Glycosyltransferase family 4 protein n=1 Tax=Gillisia lutea TaxID=2909668 RepID=A0ABS9EEP2_9FLAO|nr:glycosyltransferase family 1 protein [Gillisia lutea]MCF4101333.1 glycosyltransferase family 4 protein [Gillisia lutea]
MPNEKNVLLESHNINNMFTGFGQFNYWLIKNIVQNTPEFKITVTASHKSSIKDFQEKVIFKKYHPYHRKKLFRIRKKYDLWHSMNQNISVEPYFSIPYILTIHDVIFMEENTLSKEKKDKKFQRLQGKIDRSTAIVYISEYAKQETNRYFNISDKIIQRVIYNGNPITPVPPVTPAPTTLVPKKPFLFTIGQFMQKKNFHTLIGMLSFMENHHLVIAGNYNRPYREVIEKEIEKYNLTDNVFLVGKISDEEKHFYLQNCESLVFPSLHEGFGMPPIEAMAYGKPVFLANRSSLPEIGGQFAFFWDRFEAEYMHKVYEEKMKIYNENIKVYTEKLKERAASFNWDTTAKQYLKLYSEILHRN